MKSTVEAINKIWKQNDQEPERCHATDGSSDSNDNTVSLSLSRSFGQVLFDKHNELRDLRSINQTSEKKKLNKTNICMQATSRAEWLKHQQQQRSKTTSDTKGLLWRQIMLMLFMSCSRLWKTKRDRRGETTSRHQTTTTKTEDVSLRLYMLYLQYVRCAQEFPPIVFSRGPAFIQQIRASWTKEAQSGVTGKWGENKEPTKTDTDQ